MYLFNIICCYIIWSPKCYYNLSTWYNWLSRCHMSSLLPVPYCLINTVFTLIIPTSLLNPPSQPCHVRIYWKIIPPRFHSRIVFFFSMTNLHVVFYISIIIEYMTLSYILWFTLPSFLLCFHVTQSRNDFKA